LLGVTKSDTVQVAQLSQRDRDQSIFGNENRLKIGVLQWGGSVSAKFSHRRDHPRPIIDTRIDRRMNALQFVADDFHSKKLCSRLSSSEVRSILYGKRPFCVL